MEVLILGNKLLEKIGQVTNRSQEITSDILLLRFTIVNACLIGDPLSDGKEFVLVDTGLENSHEFILDTIDKTFGQGAKPTSIVLTHGHFDHLGSVIKLSDYWDIPVYIHELEIPYMTGKKDYPLGEPSVGGGMVIDISDRAVTLPSDGTIPGMPGWKWIHTPGHTQGHISLFRQMDRVLIAGDAFSSTKQESFLSVAIQGEQISGPPAYLTEDWEAAKESIIKLRELEPHRAITGHGKPMRGIEVIEHLDYLIENFDEVEK